MNKRDILSDIVKRRLELVREAEAKLPLNELKRKINPDREKRSFAQALRKDFDAINIIAEIKRRSPSKGVIKDDIDITQMARAYQDGGASAISVLTEPEYFAGSLNDMIAVRESVSLPVLRKDFIVTEYQVYESAAAGADAILLIVRCLDDEQLKSYFTLAKSLGMDALVEVHDTKDIERLSCIRARIIGINNRDLKTFDTSVTTAIKLSGALKGYQLPVALSGINKLSDICLSKSYGISSFLIGESIMRSDNPREFIRALKGGR
ncbi:MAG: indole-3-glycerol phosphate synthase TrpC [Phycisphaerae bacterium]|jgi:indole-3-glycerol phosphate synthase